GRPLVEGAVGLPDPRAAANGLDEHRGQYEIAGLVDEAELRAVRRLERRLEAREFLLAVAGDGPRAVGGLPVAGPEVAAVGREGGNVERGIGAGIAELCGDVDRDRILRDALVTQLV